MSVTNKKIKLVVGISDFRIGGAQKIVADLLQHFDKDLLDIHLVTFFQSPNEDDFYDLLPNHITIHKFNLSGFLDLRGWWGLYKLLIKLKPDIAWSHLFFSNTLFRVLKPFFKYKVIIVEHNTYVTRAFSERATNFILSLFTYKVVAVAEFVADYLQKREAIPQNKIQVIHNGVNVHKVQEMASRANRIRLLQDLGLGISTKIVLNVGQLIKQKNQELLIEAFAKFSATRPEYVLLILGEGSGRVRLESIVKERGLSRKVLLPGIRKEVPQYMSISDFFVLSSRFEGFPIVAIEALACALPIITTPVSSSSEYVKEGENGFIVLPTADSLADGMTQLADAEESVIRSRKNCSLSLSQQYDLSKTAHLYEKLFVSVMDTC